MGKYSWNLLNVLENIFFTMQMLLLSEANSVSALADDDDDDDDDDDAVLRIVI